MILRADSKVKIIDRFLGVNDLIDVMRLPDEFVPWLSGASPSDGQDVERISGKLAMNDTSACGNVLTLREVEFSDRRLFIVHASCVTLTHTSLAELRVSMTSTVPFNAFL